MGSELDIAQPTLRERTRRAVQAELIDVAQQLFVEQGYELTTVDQIAAAAGMSKRSFFRFFGSKEAIITGKYEAVIEVFVESLRGRPGDEPLWTSLRRIFDYVVDYADDAELAQRMATIDAIVQSSDVLRGAHFARLDRAQEMLTQVARDRASATGKEWGDPGDPSPRAIVGAAFACLQAARRVAATTGKPLGPLLDTSMATISPSIDT
ncbi:TetR/AcrR family transcriptional regulator [Cellulomonas sp. NPDC058312]|uniref:TetR/AcrR family transcriptional regulator n=1 Tax=Cellulomonas sp. NPDC058312 TaxID=3346441 RepID=UPI0036F16B77